MLKEVEIQRKYYAETAHDYNSRHVHEKGEHQLSAALLIAMLDYYDIKTILDIGSGTGRMIQHLKHTRPDIQIIGIEPVAELRAIGHHDGISDAQLIDGDATALDYADGEFDLVCEFGALHHIKKPQLAVAEMLRVASKGIFISDANNFGQGSVLARSIKQALNLFGLWPLADWIKTGGKGYTISEGDGLAYSYSVFSNLKQIKQQCPTVHFMNTTDGGPNLYRSASHISLLAIK